MLPAIKKITVNELRKIDKALIDTVKDSDLQNVTTILAETFTDSLLTEGILKEIPIIKTVVGLTKTTLGIRNRLFIKKLITFLTELKDIEPEKRAKMISNINTKKEKKIRVGEKLIYILDKCDDHVDSKYVAQFFCAFLEEKITYNEFLRGASIIQNIFREDLEYFIESKIETFEKENLTEESPNEVELPLINAGILGFGYNPVNVNDQDDWKASEKYVISGGEAVIWVTTIGKKMKEHLKSEK